MYWNIYKQKKMGIFDKCIKSKAPKKYIDCMHFHLKTSV